MNTVLIENWKGTAHLDVIDVVDEKIIFKGLKNRFERHGLD
jgi:hypothetical protein